eukprot:CAMPEP_0170605494 /NCGR_PEP_ID=MMETSP0224-20130122/20003_1 /TAXON_ID=285029 /ORGANISM="Togula jolla, Strain CCCM 725" /LENGTH=181 /DNA_ID=CAMNT_0010930501 /DNA_START=98 /DNA_END=641 /DNA_ORIENTATION=-
MSQETSLDDQIRKAQLAAGQKLFENKGMENGGPVSPEDFCGNWRDSYGNTVSVYSKDAFETRLIATLSKPPRPDVNLPVFTSPHSYGWQCGGATLVAHTQTQLWWAFQMGASPSGRGGLIAGFLAGLVTTAKPRMASFRARSGLRMTFFLAGFSESVGFFHTSAFIPNRLEFEWQDAYGVL